MWKWYGSAVYINMKEKTWTLLRLTALNSKLAMYIIIFLENENKLFMKQRWVYLATKKERLVIIIFLTKAGD